MIRRRPLAALAALALALPVVNSAPAWAANPAGITSVTAEADVITVKGVSPVGQVAVYALDSWQDPAEHTGQQPVATVTAGADGSFTARVSRMDGDDDRFSDKFLAVAAGEVLGEPHYVDDVRFPGVNDAPYPQVAGKKGLQVEMTDDAEEVGTHHAAVNVPIDAVMMAGPGAPDNTIEFVSQGRTFYFDKANVAQQDAQIKPLSDNGMLVNLILILYQNGSPNSAWPKLVHPDAEIGRGTVYAFDTKTAEGTAYLTAAMEFLAQRYSRADGRHGRAVGWIVGNEIDAQRFWYNMGPQPLEKFLEHYTRAMRITWQAVRKADTNGRVYTSLTHFWNAAVGGDALREYKGRDVVDGLNALSKRQGDFPWHIAQHPYPENLFNPAFWNDRTATPGFDTQRITFKNIEVLPRYLAQEAQRYRGEPRRIILSEQGLNSQDYTEESLRLQAAAYAYAYYKVAFLDGIDNFILHRHVDHQHEGGLRLGLWTWDEEHKDVAMPGERKPLYEVFKYIDTERSLEVTEFAKDIIGISDWSDVIPGFDPARLAVRQLPAAGGMQRNAKPVLEKIVSKFDEGVDGWRASDNTAGVSQADGALRVHFDTGLPAWFTYAKTWKGADLVLDRPLDARLRSHLSVSVRVPRSADDGFRPGNVFYGKVRVYGGAGQVIEGVSRIDPAAGWNRLTLDLSRWGHRDSISRIKVWVRGSVGDDWKGSYELDRVSLAVAAVPSFGDRNLDVIGKTTERGQIGSAVTFTVTNNDLLPMVGKVELRTCDGVIVDPAVLDVAGLKTGQSRTFTTKITAFAPANGEYPAVCARYLGAEQRVTFRLAPPSQYVPPNPDAFANREFSDGFDTDSSARYRVHRVLPEDKAVPSLTVGGGTLSAHHGTESWYGAVSSDTSPRNPAFATILAIKKFQGTSTDMDTVYTGLVKDGQHDILAFYVNTHKFTGFEVRGSHIPGGIKVFGIKTGVTIPDGSRFAMSLVGNRAATYVDSGDGWKLLNVATLEDLPDLTDAAVRAQYTYGFGVRGDAGTTPLVIEAVEGRSVS